MFPEFVKIVEVSPRDGLQNEPRNIPTDIKVKLINQLTETGLTSIETTSFVSPKAVPQLSDAKAVLNKINQKPGVDYPVLVPNLEGLENALTANAKSIAVLTTVCETFSQKNTHCSIEESIHRIRDIMPIAIDNNLKVRGYISCVLGCPYEGHIEYDKTLEIAGTLLELGCYEVSLGDTIGIGTPNKVQQLFDILLSEFSVDKFAVHFHNTYGMALVNIYEALKIGVTVIDSSVAGLGGCPYASGASGNVATEDVLYLLNGLGIKTGVDADKIVSVAHFISDVLGHPPRSSVALARK